MKEHTPWIYKGKEVERVEDLPEKAYGFIYEITYKPTGEKYLGKKVLYFRRNVKIGKRELEKIKEERKKKKLPGRAPSKKLVVKESDWKKYYGSHKTVKELVKKSKPEEFKREILKVVFEKKHLTYYENKYLFTNEVIEPGSKYFNDNIEGRYFKKDF